MKDTSGVASAEELVEQPYKYGFVTEIEEEKIPKDDDPTEVSNSHSGGTPLIEFGF